MPRVYCGFSSVLYRWGPIIWTIVSPFDVRWDFRGFTHIASTLTNKKKCRCAFPFRVSSCILSWPGVDQWSYYAIIRQEDFVSHGTYILLARRASKECYNTYLYLDKQISSLYQHSSSTYRKELTCQIIADKQCSFTAIYMVYSHEHWTTYNWRHA